MTDDATETTDEPVVRPFSEFLLQQQYGRTHDELGTALHDLIAAVRETGKAGKLTLTIDVKPLGARDGHQLLVADVVTTKMPQGERPTSMYFVDGDGNLTRTDPTQLSFNDLREVEDRRAGKELKEAK